MNFMPMGSNAAKNMHAVFFTVSSPHSRAEGKKVGRQIAEKIIENGDASGAKVSISSFQTQTHCLAHFSIMNTQQFKAVIEKAIANLNIAIESLAPAEDAKTIKIKKEIHPTGFHIKLK